MMAMRLDQAYTARPDCIDPSCHMQKDAIPGAVT